MLHKMGVHWAMADLNAVSRIIQDIADPLMGRAPLLPTNLRDASPDREIENLLIARLGEIDPGSRFFAEEAYKNDQTTVRHLTGPGRTYIIDPIDNTTAFLEGTTNIFAVMVARLDSGKLTAGWMYYPALSLMLMGEEGKGAFVNGTPLVNRYRQDQPVGTETTRSMTLNVSPNSSRSIRSIADAIDRYKEQFPRINERRAVCEHAIDLLVEQTGDIFLNRVPWPWDTAPFYAIYKAWGGHITFPDGSDDNIHQIHMIGQVLAPNAAMLKAACETALPLWPALNEYNVNKGGLWSGTWGAPAAASREPK